MTQAQKEALCLVLDVSPTMGASFPIAKEVASSLLQQKLVFSPRDEIGLLFSGDTKSNNRMHASFPNKYKNLNVVRPIMVPAADFLNPLGSAEMNKENTPGDMFDAIVVAADLIHERTDKKKYNRRIVFVTNANCAVRAKEDLQSIIDSLKAQSIGLVVIGIDFEEDDDVDEDVDWSTLTSKQQNERVLRFMCAQLPEDDRSIVVPVSDAATALSALRKRNIPQRTLTRCVLGIGEVKIPVYLYVKTLAQSFPSMHRTTVKGDYVTERRYFSVRKPDEEIDASQRVKAFRYGKSVIPFNEVDEAQMKFPAHRSMEALGFLPMKSIPIHMLLGGVKAVAPPPDDSTAAKALAAFAHGMEHLQKVMLVRYVWRESTDPSLGICFPSVHADRDILYYVPLPFAEDLRSYWFDEEAVRHPKLRSGKVKPPPAGGQMAVSNLVKAMTVDDSCLDPETTFNPALQQYYTALRARYLDDQAPIPDLSAELRRTCCGWGEAGNVLEPILKGAKDILQQVSHLYPSAAPKDKKGAKADKIFWYTKGKTAATEVDPSEERPKKKARTDNYFHSNTTQTTNTATGTSGPSSLADGIVTSTAPKTFAVTTVDPVGTFKAMLKAPGEDQVAVALFQMTEVIFRLLRDSIGDQYYARVYASILALREACIQEAEPSAFNKFLLNFALTVRGEAHDLFWATYIVGKNVMPITKGECDESDISDEHGASFLQEDRLGPKDAVEDEVDEDLFDQLE